MRPPVESPAEVPVAEAVMTRVPQVQMQDGVTKALETLREHGVAVLVDDQGRPWDILTSCDLDKVRSRAARLEKTSLASELFEKERREVHRVRRNEDLRSVAQEISRKRLSTGIVVVDDRERYLGYVFNNNLREKAADLVEKAKARAEYVQANYPEAWSTLGGRLPSSSR